jgi:hypothetical protein
MKEAVGEMAATLLGMGQDTYMRCKLALLSASRRYPEDNEFMRALFNYTGRRRRPLIGCAGAGEKEPESGIKK